MADGVADRLAGEVETRMVEWLGDADDTIRLGSESFRLAFLDETDEANIPDDALVLIDPASGDMYELEVIVSAHKIERPKDRPPADPNQLSILDAT